MFVLPHLFYSVDLVSYDFWLKSAIKEVQNECRFNSGHITKTAVFQCHMVYSIWRHLWRYRIDVNIKIWYPQKPHILTFTLIPWSFFSDHCVKLYGWMCITFQMPLVYTNCISWWDQMMSFFMSLTGMYTCMSLWFSNPSSCEVVYCFICGRRMVVIAQYWMICLVLMFCCP